MKLRLVFTVLSAAVLAACGGGDSAGADRGGPPGRGGGPPGGMGPGAEQAAAAVPVRTEAVARGSISDDLQTTGTLEAEEEVDLVARAAGPVTEILVEEGARVATGQLLARIDDREARNVVDQRTVTLEDARLTFQRAQSQQQSGLISDEAFDATTSALQSAEAQLEAARIQLADTEVRAPYSGVVSVRYVKKDQYVGVGTPLFRMFADDPLLCRIQVPEKDLTRVAVGQTARLRVEAFPDREFTARIARIRPSVDGGTGTVAVTLDVPSRGILRPGMFAAVAVETDQRDGVVVIPRQALVLDAIGDVVFVVEDGVAHRREVSLGVRSEDRVEVTSGLSEGEALVVLGQDGLADGTPVTPLDGSPGTAVAEADEASAEGPDPARLEEIKQRMRERGLSDAEIEERLQRMRSGGGPPSGAPAAAGGDPAAQIPPFMRDRIRDAAPEDLERIKQRMQQFGMSEEQVNAVVRSIRGEEGGS